MLAERGFRVDPLRQPRHRPLDDDRLGGDARPARHDRAAGATALLPADGHGRRHLRPDGPPRDRVGARGRRLDGRDDRPDDGDRAARAGPLAGLDDVDHRQPLGRVADLEGAARSSSPTIPRSREAYIERRSSSTFEVIGSPGYPDGRGPASGSWPGDCCDRSHNPAGVLRQMHAITRLRRPHPGAAQARPADDRAPRHRATRWCARAGGRATAKAIPGARLRMFEGMGHDLPRQLWPDFVEEIAANRRAAATDGRAGLRPCEPAYDAAERSRTFTELSPTRT